MKAPTLDAVMQRLDRVERENRRWRLLGGIAVAVVALLSLLGATHERIHDEIKAKHFVVVDSNGTPRIKVGDIGFSRLDEPGGLPGLGIADRRGRIRARLALWPKDLRKGTEYATLNLYNESGQPLAILGVDDGPSLTLYRTAGEREIGVFSASVGDSGPSVSVRADRRGPGVALDAGNQYAQLHVDGGASHKAPRAGLTFEGGKVRLALKDDALLASRVVLGSLTLEHPATGVKEERPTSSLVLFDKDGKVTWKAP